MKVVILAGGMGTRISEESHLRPKPMIEIGGSPMLWHIMKIYSHYGYHEFVICAGYKSHVIKEYFSDYYLHLSDVTFDFSADNKITIHNNVAEPWKVTIVYTGLTTNTGGRIQRVLPYLNNEQFMLTYGDGVSDLDIAALVKQHNQSDKLATLTAVKPSGRFGALEIDDSTSTVTGFSEKIEGDGNWVNGGFMILEPEVAKYLSNTDIAYDTLVRLSAERRLGVFKHTGFWQCMDTQRDKQLLEYLWGNGNAPWKIW